MLFMPAVGTTTSTWPKCARLGLVRTASQVRADGIEATADQMRRALTGVEGCWLHVDVDILDPAVLPAVDSPVAGGLDANELTALLATLAPTAIGADVTIFDPDLDPTGGGAGLLTDIVVEGLAGLGSARD